MPLYDFKCLDCGETFEALVLPKFDPPVCPACQSRKLEQLLSLFSVDSETTRQASLKVAQRKRSSLKRDYDMAQIEYEKHHHH